MPRAARRLILDDGRCFKNCLWRMDFDKTRLDEARTDTRQSDMGERMT